MKLPSTFKKAQTLGHGDKVKVGHSTRTVTYVRHFGQTCLVVLNNGDVFEYREPRSAADVAERSKVSYVY